MAGHRSFHKFIGRRTSTGSKGSSPGMRGRNLVRCHRQITRHLNKLTPTKIVSVENRDAVRARTSFGFRRKLPQVAHPHPEGLGENTDPPPVVHHPSQLQLLFQRRVRVRVQG